MYVKTQQSLYPIYYAEGDMFRPLWAILRSQKYEEKLKTATRIPPQPSHTETPTHIETRTHNQCGDTIEKSQAPDDGYINVRNMLSVDEVK